MFQNHSVKVPWFSVINVLLDSLIYQLKVLLSVNPKVPVSNPLMFVEKAKEYWRLGNEGQALVALQSARDSCDGVQKKFNLIVYYQLISDVLSLLEVNEKNDREKSRKAMLLWLRTIQTRPFVSRYHGEYFRLYKNPSVQHFLMLFATIAVNVFMLPLYAVAVYSLIQLWKISVSSFAVLCFITICCLLLRRVIPNMFSLFLIGFLPILIFLTPITTHENALGVLYYFFFMVSLMLLILCIEMIRAHFQAARYGKLSYMCLRSHEENGERVWESVIVDANGDIVRVRKSRFRSRVVYPFWPLFPSSVFWGSEKACKQLGTFRTWQILPLFLSNPSKRMPKTSGFAWWLKSRGFWFLSSSTLFSHPFTWKYDEDKACSFVPLNVMSTPILWDYCEEAGVEFNDDEIAEFLSRCPSPLRDLPGYEEYMASQWVEER